MPCSFGLVARLAPAMRRACARTSLKTRSIDGIEGDGQALPEQRPDLEDLIASLVAGAAVMAVFASFELVENLYELTRAYADWDLDEILTCIFVLQ